MNDEYIQKGKIILYGIDDELKNDTTSIYTTVINSSYFDAPQADSTQTIDGVSFITRASGFTTKKNTKRYRFTLNNANLKGMSLSTKAKLVIESVCLPNVISQSYLQSKAVNNVILRLLNIPNNNIFDSSSKGRNGSIIFSTPILLNTQGFGTTYNSGNNNAPDNLTTALKPRINCDNNGVLYINTSPLNLYSYPISEDFIRNGFFELEIIYDIGNCWRNSATNNTYDLIPQTLDYTTDKDDLEAFMISFIIMDVEDDGRIYNDKELLNKINKLLLKKP